MKQKVNKYYSSLFTKKPRYFILMGGRSAGRSTTASQFALAKLTAPEYFRCAIMRFVYGDIRNSIFQDIRDRVEENEIEDQVKVKEQTLGFYYGNNKINGIGFRKSSSDQKSKLKSLANYNCVIIEEADEVSEEDFMQLDDSLRTLKSDIVIILLLNPPSKQHWIVKRWFNLEKAIEGFFKATLKESRKEDTEFISTTYKQNLANVNESSIKNFENYKLTRPDHYYNMIKGYISDGATGRIFKDWKTISDKEFEELPYASFYGLDFGFTNDPTALVEVKKHNNNVWLRELIYETGLTNPLIAKRLENLGVPRSATIYADNAEPKSIKEIRDLNWNILPAIKGAGSVNAGIDMLMSKNIFYTESSENLKTETLEYVWALDKNKNPTNNPRDLWNHCFVYNTLITTDNGLKKIGDINIGDKVLTRNGYNKILKKWDNGIKQTVDYCLQLDTEVLKLTCTPNHLILTQKGWVKISQLKSGMTIFYIKNLTEKHTSYIQKKDIFLGGVEECMLSYGNIIMVKLIKVFRSIIKIGILGIIGLKILNWLKQTNIYRNILKKDLKKIQSGQKNFIEKGLKVRNIGMGAKRAESGIQKIVKKLGRIENTESLFAKYAEKTIKQGMPEYQNTVIQTAKLKHLDVGEERLERVYDLTIDNNHEYLANGLLVHNCMDGTRYAVYSDSQKGFIGFV